MTYTEFTLFYFHGIMFRNFLHHTKLWLNVEGDAAGLDYIDKVSKRAVEIIFHADWEKSVLKSVSNRTNSWYSRN